MEMVNTEYKSYSPIWIQVHEYELIFFKWLEKFSNFNFKTIKYNIMNRRRMPVMKKGSRI